MSSENLHNEKELLKRIAEGDEQAFAVLFHTYHKTLGDYIYKLTQSRSISEEITQEAFIKAWQQRITLTEVISFRSWLFAVSRNQAFNAMRDESRRLLKHSKWIKQQNVTLEMTSTTDITYLDEMIARAIEQLPPQQQRAYLLSREKGLKHAQIAEQMHISSETVKRHISLALQAVTSYLRSHYPDFPTLVILSLMHFSF